MQLGAIPPTEIIFTASLSPGTAVQKIDKATPPAPAKDLRDDLLKKPLRDYSILFALNLKPATYEQVMHHVLGTKQVLALPAKGNYFFRFGVHDTLADKIGAMEVPVDDVKPGIAGPGQTLTPYSLGR